MTTQLEAPIAEKPQAPASPKRQPAATFGRALQTIYRVLLLSVVCLFACEGIMSLAHVGEEDFVQIDPVLGYWHRADSNITFRREGYSNTQMNSAGFRGPNVPLAKPPGMVRIAALGDSKTESLQVSDDATFASILERRLNQEHKDGARYQLLNFGMSAYSTGQEYLLLRERILPYKPDIVVLEYNVGDSDENTSSAGTLGMPRPYFYLDSGTLCVDWTPMQNWMSSDNARFYYGLEQLRHTRFWGIVSKLQLNLASDSSLKPMQKYFEKPWSAVSAWLLKCLPQPSWQVPARIGTRLGKFDVPSSFSPVPHDPDPVVQQFLVNSCRNWPVTAALISAINETCEQSGIRLIVAGLPGPTGWQSHLWELKQIRDQSRREGFTYVDVNKAFPSLPPGKQSRLYIKTHFSEAGHRLLADALYGPLIQEISKAGKPITQDNR